MTFTAGEFPLAIDYKLKGKRYNVNPFELKQAPPGTATTDPFDTFVIQPSGSWDLPEGAEFIRQRELRGAATPQGGTPE